MCFLCGEGISANPFLGFLANVLTRQDDLDSKLHHKKKTKNILPTEQFRPKIFFAPNNNSVTESIIKRANKTFAVIDDLNDGVDKALYCSEEFEWRVPRYSQQAQRLNQVSAEGTYYLLLLWQVVMILNFSVATDYVRLLYCTLWNLTVRALRTWQLQCRSSLLLGADTPSAAMYVYYEDDVEQVQNSFHTGVQRDRATSSPA